MHAFARKVMAELKYFRRLSWWKQAGAAVIMVILGAVIRHLTFEINPLVPYLPILVLIIFMFRPWVAIGAAFLSAAISIHYFVVPLWEIRRLSAEWWAILVIYICTKTLMTILADALHKAYSDLDLIIGELNHRVKNTMALVQSIVAQTFKQTSDLGSFQEALKERLDGLSKSHSLLTEVKWNSVPLRQIIMTQLRDFSSHDEEACSINGQHILIHPSSIVTLGMIFHELMTNAVKHGALNPERRGRIHISWKVDQNGPLSISWEEDGQSIEQQSTQRGFGSRLLERLVTSVGGDLSVQYKPSGLSVCIQVSLDAVRA